MATIGPFSIRFDQRKSDNSAYKETYVSGSNLIIITDNIGTVTGSQTIETATINQLTSSNSKIINSIFTGIASFFNILYAYGGVVGNITGSISGSTATVTHLTASYISGSITQAVNSTYLNNTASTSFATTGSNTFIGSQTITGSIQANTGSFNQLILNNTSSAPTNSTDPGIIGELRMDNNYLYLYSNNKWHRIPKCIWT